MSRRSARNRGRVDYNEMSRGGANRTYSVYGNSLLAESETTELTGTTPRISMPRHALRQRNPNVESSGVIEEKLGAEDDDDFVVEDDEIVEEIVAPDRPEQPTTRRLFARAVTTTVVDDGETETEQDVVERDSLLRKVRSELESKFGGKSSRREKARMQQQQAARPRRRWMDLSPLTIGGFVLLNLVTLSLVLLVLTNSERSVYEAVSNSAKRAVPWARFVRRADLSNLIELSEDSRRNLENKLRGAVQSVYQEFSSGDYRYTSDEVARDVVERLAADRTGRPDFALISGGARVLHSRPSKLVQVKDFVVERLAYFVGRRQISLDAYPRPPEAAFEVDMTPGNCWGFDGSTSNVTVLLSRPVVVDTVSVEHVYWRSVPSIATAPKRFRAYALESSIAESRLGEFEFIAGENQSSLQSFAVEPPTFARAVRLEILSNHGGDYTCLYRFRVHGNTLDRD